MSFEKTYSILGTGDLLAHFEQSLYVIADNFIENYNGGLWQEVTTKNGFFWILSDKKSKTYNISTPGGTKKENVNAEFCGIVITFMALHYLLEKSFDRLIVLSSSDLEKISKLIGAINDYVYDEKNDEKFANDFFALVD